ncbi:MAG: pyruvate formate lyase-activating protein [Oxalobacter sp.]|nr:MAG: pyruvate formate lyase-activating protein [Oxalobacter sp.]
MAQSGTITITPVTSLTQGEDKSANLVGNVHSTLAGGAVDGPGLRFVLFMSGCQMRCLYCHNPDTWDRMGGTPRTVDDVMEEIGKYADFLKKAGGVTVTGGEPLLQAEFVHEVMRRCKEEYGLHTALDTNGLRAFSLPDDWFDVVDLVLLDIKHIDPAKHARLTSTTNRPVLEFAQRLARMSKPTWVRYVLVPGYTDDVNDVEKLAEFVSELKNVERVEVLPFHQMGAYKWKQLRLRYELADKQSPTDEVLGRVKKQFEKKGLTVV